MNAIGRIGDLEGFIFDRVAERRKKYPWIALMTVRRNVLETESLEKQIKRFNDEGTRHRASWRAPSRNGSKR